MNYQTYLYYIPLGFFITSMVFLMGMIPFYDGADSETQSIMWNTFLGLMFTTLLSFMVGVGILLWDFGEEVECLHTEPFILNADDKISKEFPTFNEYWNSRK